MTAPALLGKFSIGSIGEIPSTLRLRVIIAPITSKGQPLGRRPLVPFEGKQARILLDQLRAVDKGRLTRKMGLIEPALWAVPASKLALEAVASYLNQLDD